MPGPFRQTDAVLTIAQDNARHTIEVNAANDVAGDLLGFTPEELQGMAFSDIVSEKVAEALDDYVEYQTGANDVGDVLRKMRDFRLKGKDGTQMPMRLKIVRHHSQSLDEYLLIMHDEEGQKASNAALSALMDAFHGHVSLNEDTGLPDRSSLQKGLELVEQHRDNIKNGICFAVMEIDNYPNMLGKYGVQACHHAVSAIAQLCKQNLRGNDVIAQADDCRLALILVGAGKEPAKIVLNRLRWLIAGLQLRTGTGQEFNGTVTIVFNALLDGTPAPALLERFEKHLDEKPETSENLVVEG